MTNVQRRSEAHPLTRLDRMFDEWFRTLPVRRPFAGFDGIPGEDVIRVDEFREDDHEVIRAELPDIDPDKDVDVSVQDGMLRIAAQRRVEEQKQDTGYTRRELRYGSFSRTLPLPDGADENDIKASYKDGILEIRVPVSEPSGPAEPTKVTISRS